jgi:1,2-diacylglycerol 3-beta-glucosyltransferase
MILLSMHAMLLFVVGGFLLYLLGLSVLALVARKHSLPSPSRFTRFAVLVPAHNEQLAIAATIRSIKQVNYPADAFEVIVIADNCTDDTGLIAGREGARVLTRDVSDLRGKGHALRWCFDELRGSAYEAYAVVDADSTVSGNFLSVLNIYRLRGAEVIQCNDQVQPQAGAWSSEAIRFGFLLYNYVRPMGRKLIGGSSGLRGNGMCFSPDVLLRIPWDAYSRAEDLEYSLRLALQGVRVTFAPEATVLATMTRDARLAESQRARWEGGRIPLVKSFAVPLLLAALRRRSLMIVDVLLDLVTPALVNLVVCALLGCVIALAQWGVGDARMKTMAILWAGALGCGLLHAILGLVAAGSGSSLPGLIGLVPRYAFWKFRLYYKLLRHGDTHEWKRTTREPERIQ